MSEPVLRYLYWLERDQLTTSCRVSYEDFVPFHVYRRAICDCRDQISPQSLVDWIYTRRDQPDICEICKQPYDVRAIVPGPQTLELIRLLQPRQPPAMITLRAERVRRGSFLNTRLLLLLCLMGFFKPRTVQGTVILNSACALWTGMLIGQMITS